MKEREISQEKHFGFWKMYNVDKQSESWILRRKAGKQRRKKKNLFLISFSGHTVASRVCVRQRH